MSLQGRMFCLGYLVLVYGTHFSIKSAGGREEGKEFVQASMIVKHVIQANPPPLMLLLGQEY